MKEEEKKEKKDICRWQTQKPYNSVSSTQIDKWLIVLNSA